MKQTNDDDEEHSISLDSLYANWTRFLEERNLATEHEFRHFVGIRPSRQHASMRRESSLRYPKDEEYATEELARSCIGMRSSRAASARELASLTRRRLSTDKYSVPAPSVNEESRDPEEKPSKNCLFHLPRELTLDPTERRLRQPRHRSYFSPLACIAGISDAADNDDCSEATRNGTKNQLKRVAFLDDLVDCMPRVEERSCHLPTRVSQHTDATTTKNEEQDLDELQAELAEIRLLTCLDEAELWLGLYDFELKRVCSQVTSRASAPNGSQVQLFKLENGDAKSDSKVEANEPANE